jgi:hypothetical protein|tara:strand:+ start:3678 stop:3836 length:159 start_codon:yes stop_codon:yes gene_type:complete
MSENYKPLSEESKEDIWTVYAELCTEATIIHPKGIDTAKHLASYLDEEDTGQ